MDTKILNPTTLVQALKPIQTMQHSGKLVIQQQQLTPSTWYLYFCLGRIIWATGGCHRNKRWVRVMKGYCPALLSEAWISKTSAYMSPSQAEVWDYWEVQAMAQALQEGVISADSVRSVITHYVQEVFFNILDPAKADYQWIASKELPKQFVWLDLNQVTESATLSSEQWQKSIGRQWLPTDLAGLPLTLTPDMAPTIQDDSVLQQRVSPSVYSLLSKVITGQNTFWDIAAAMQKPLTPMVLSLLPLIQDQVIQFHEIPDLSFPGAAADLNSRHRLPGQGGTTKGVIACIDDSPLIGKALETILQPFGYEVVSILDPLQSLTTLVQRKPRLIFLDLVMPNTNGYELCSFLRKSPLFRETPIVMLTGQDGVVDRIRAKVVGSTEFMGKPPERNKVIQVVRRLIGEEASPRPPLESG